MNGVEHAVVSGTARLGLLLIADALEAGHRAGTWPQTVCNALAIDCRFLAEHR